MLGAYDFCGHYEWTFEWLKHEGGEALVHDYWKEAIAHDSQLHARDLVVANGLDGMSQYWGHTLEEEGAGSVITQREGVFRIDMHECPSKGFLLRNDLQQYHDYCDHCIGWIHPILTEAGFRIDHQHNHCGQCWWEMRPVESQQAFSSPGEVTGDDVRLTNYWKEGLKYDSFFHNVTGVSAASTAAEDVSNPMVPNFITALPTPLLEDDNLHVEALDLIIAQQRSGGISNLLVGGTMGAMQLLPDQTYCDLMSRSVSLMAGQGEILAGAGDASFSRTRDRIEFLNTLSVDGVVVLAPYVMPFSQEELVDYFSALANFSHAPLFLYDLPKLTGTKISQATVETLARHPNIAGIKCSDEPGYARQVRDAVRKDFRIILAAPTLIDVFLRSGYAEHLDGIYALCPQQVTALGTAATEGDWEYAAELQQGIARLLRLLQAGEVWRPCTALLHELGVVARFKPHPHRDWDTETTQQFLHDEETQAVLSFLRASNLPPKIVAAS